MSFIEALSTTKNDDATTTQRQIDNLASYIRQIVDVLLQKVRIDPNAIYADEQLRNLGNLRIAIVVSFSKPDNTIYELSEFMKEDKEEKLTMDERLKYLEKNGKSLITHQPRPTES